MGFLKWEDELSGRTSPRDMSALLAGSARELASTGAATALAAFATVAAVVFCEGEARSLASGAWTAAACASLALMARRGSVGDALDAVEGEAARGGFPGEAASFFAGGSMEMDNVGGFAAASGAAAAFLAAFWGAAEAVTGDAFFKGAWVMPAGAVLAFLAAAAAARLRSRVLWRRFERAVLEAAARSRIEGGPGEAGGVAGSTRGETTGEGGRDGLV